MAERLTPENTRALIAEALACSEREREVLGEDAYVGGLLTRLVDELRTLSVPDTDNREAADGDARERLMVEVLSRHVPVTDAERRTVGCRCMDRVFLRLHESWADHLGDAILAAFPVLSRDIAGEIEAEAEKFAGPIAQGLRRAAEIVRNGR